ncbi:HAD family phosphatase [uncultured Holdemanella sp.]|uniref:HAD family hydrolase n=1 Tax=uncultured Holdemanella sp. TaxID=1763549 RepID=UPI0025DDE089|nr:HAD family phosphatase [uncultured Holdemanella sp.]
MLELVAFDVDGLMIDTESVWKNAFDKAGDKYGIPNLGDTLFPSLIGKRLEDEQELLDRLLPSDIQNQLINEWRQIGLGSLEREVPVKPGLYEMLDFLEQHHIKMAVATTTRRELTEQRLKKIGVYDRFEYVLCGDEVTKRKPDPEIYLSVLHKMNTKAENAIVLEDSSVGVEAAYRAGIDCIQVPDLIAPTEIQKKQTIYTAKDLMEARDYIEENMVQSIG